MRRHLLILTLALGLTAACDATPPADSSAANAPRPADPKAIPAPPDVAAIPADATTLPSGLAFKILKAGTGKVHPTPNSTVVADYTGWMTNGEMFDSSVVKGTPLIWPLYKLIPGWVEGMQLMVAGEKRRLWVPEKLAYGGAPGAPSGMLVFDVELLDVK